LRLLHYFIIKSVFAAIRCERRRHDIPEILLILRAPELLAKAAIDVTEGASNKGVCSRLAQFGLQGLNQRNQDLSLDFGLLNDRNADAQPFGFE
jgi:hypothetical protein